MDLEHSVGIVYLARRIELGQLLGPGGRPSRLNLLSQRRQPRIVELSGRIPVQEGRCFVHFPARIVLRISASDCSLSQFVEVAAKAGGSGTDRLRGSASRSLNWSIRSASDPRIDWVSASGGWR